MNEGNTIASKGDGKPWGTIIRMGFGLLMVFVGVWGALWAENSREEDRSAVAILEAALTNLRETEDWSTAWRDSVNAEYADWKVRRSQGEMIPLFFMRIPGSESPAAGIFEVASDRPGVLGPEVVSKMNARANEMEGVGRRNSRYMESTERVVFPLLAADPSVFYDSASGDLLPQFQGQLLLMEEILAEMTRLNQGGADLAEFLEAELRRRQ